MTTQKYIPSIDGLRALAVLAVILFHGFPGLFPGGFIGVDIFFVISGYLITRIIVTQVMSNQFSFSDFYSRRIRRIFPALILVFIVVYGLGWFVMLPGEFMQLGKHILAGAGFFSNWVYWLETGYFDDLAELKPLLHLWSLGIEEQFYIFWPCIVLLIIRTKLNLRNAIVGLVCISFLINVLFVKIYPSATFYLPFARTWELGLGGLVAILSVGIREFRFPNSIALLGIIGVLFPIFYLSTQSAFPGWSVVPPVLGTALLLLISESKVFPIRFISAGWIVSLGLISYPLYLWHWPVLSFGRLIKGAPLSSIETIFLLILSFFLAYISYELVEKKVRHLGKRTVLVLCVLMAGIAFQGWNTYRREGLEFRIAKNIQIPTDQNRDFIKWEKKGMLPIGDCEPGFIYPEAHVCAQSDKYGNADIVVIGDSHAFSAYWGIANAYGNNHIVKLIGQGACLPLVDAAKFGQYPSCNKNINQQIDWIANNPSVKTVFIVHRSRQLASEDLRQSFEVSVRKTFNKLLGEKKHVIYVYAIPELNFEPRLCVGEMPLGRRNPIDNCAYSLDRELDRQSSYRDAVKRVLNEFPEVKTYDPANFLCRNGICNAVIQNRVMFTDSNHLSESGSIVQGAAIKKEIPLD
jgi:peptidoglycan/LPS O-acetylase OafA/YrhL